MNPTIERWNVLMTEISNLELGSIAKIWVSAINDEGDKLQEKATKFDMCNKHDVAEATRRYTSFIALEIKVGKLSTKLEEISVILSKNCDRWNPEDYKSWADVKDQCGECFGSEYCVVAEIWKVIGE